MMPSIAGQSTAFKGTHSAAGAVIAAPICSEAIDKGEYSLLETRNGWWLTVMGRLKPGVNLAQASGQLDAISPALFQETVPTNYR